jgi:hypothetical protein
VKFGVKLPVTSVAHAVGGVAHADGGKLDIKLACISVAHAARGVAYAEGAWPTLLVAWPTLGPDAFCWFLLVFDVVASYGPPGAPE